MGPARLLPGHVRDGRGFGRQAWRTGRPPWARGPPLLSQLYRRGRTPARPRHPTGRGPRLGRERKFPALFSEAFPCPDIWDPSQVFRLSPLGAPRGIGVSPFLASAFRVQPG